MKRYLLSLAFVCLLLCTVVFAQDDHRWTAHVGAGFTPTVGDISSRLDNGWNVDVGAGLNFTRSFSTTLDYMYNGLGVTQLVLNEAQVPGGNAHVWAITVNPKLRLWSIGRVRPFIVGGVGYYRRTIQFTQPTIAPVTYYDPFFGFFYNTVIPANQVLGSISRSGPGGSLGAGFEIPLGDSGFKFYTSARYHYAATGSIPVRMVPVTFGLRW
jgi:opacity protein-like surface antigen